MNDYYKPEQNGVEGLEEFGEVGHGTNYDELDEVYIGGIRLIGRTYEPELVENFLVEHGVAPTVRVDVVYCSPTAPRTIATRADLRRGWRYEASTGLPNHMRGPAVVAEGALRFVPGWDVPPTVANAECLVCHDRDGIFAPGCSQTSNRVEDPNDGE